MDAVRRFLFEATRMRGFLARLDDVVSAAAARHTERDPLRVVVGEALAAVAMLRATVKIDGSLGIQVEADGPVRFLVAQSGPDRSVRAFARANDDPARAGAGGLLGNGSLAITIDPGPDRHRYQGVVELRGAPLSEAIERYFERSEQLDTRLWLACDGRRAAGMMLQKLPGEEADPDAWNRILHLGATVTPGELYELPAETLLRRLFPEDDIRVFRPEPVAYRCGCERSTIEAVLRAMGREDVGALLESEGRVEVRCEYCDEVYRFDETDVRSVFADS